MLKKWVLNFASFGDTYWSSYRWNDMMSEIYFKIAQRIRVRVKCVWYSKGGKRWNKIGFELMIVEDERSKQ